MIQGLHLAQPQRCALLQRRAPRRIGENDAWLVATADSIQSVGAFAVARDVLPVAQDVDGDGRLELTVYAPGSGLWRAYRLPDQQLVLEVEGPTGALPALLPLPLLKRVPGKVKHGLTLAGGRGARGHERACAPSAPIR